MPYYYYDTVGLMVMLPAVLIAFLAQYKVKSTYNRYSEVYSSRGYSGARAARMILDRYGLYHVLIEQTNGTLSDHYDPRRKVVYLSPGVYNNSSIAAVGVAAHECGHAIQHEESYAPLTVRNAIVPFTNIGSQLAIPLLFIGFMFNLPGLVMIGIFGYALLAVFQLITLPVEFNASSRALKVIDEAYLLEENERGGAKKVLNAAAMTYVAALISAAAQLLRLVLMSNRRRR